MTAAANLQERRDSLRRLLREKSLAAMLVTDELNVTYLAGFTAIREAIGIAEAAITELRSGLKLGQTEKHVADELEYKIRRRGGTCGAFPSIVGVGPRAALPHGRPTNQSRIGDSDFVLID